MKQQGAAKGADRSGKERENPPLYQIVVRTLQSEIVRGLYPVGTQLPSEAALVERFNVSRHTVREALRSLRQSGLVTSHQGRGTIVQRPGTSKGYAHHIDTIRDLFPVGVTTRYEVIDGSLIRLPLWAQLFPDIGDDRLWLQIRGFRYKPDSGVPFNEVQVFVAARFAGVGRVIETHAGSVHSTIEMIYGEATNEVEQVIECFVADEARGSLIGMKPGDVGVEVRRSFRIASDHEVAMISFNRYRHEDFTFSMSLRRVRE